MNFIKKKRIKKQLEIEAKEKWIIEHHDELLARKFPYSTQGIDEKFQFTGQLEAIEYDQITFSKFIELVGKLPTPPPDYEEEEENYTPPHLLVQINKEYLGIARVEYSKWLVATNKIKLDHFMDKNGRFIYNLDNIKEMVAYFWVRC